MVTQSSDGRRLLYGRSVRDVNVDTARREFPHGTTVRVVSGPLAGQVASVVGIDVELAEQVDETVLTIDVGADFEEYVKPSEVEVIRPPSGNG